MKTFIKDIKRYFKYSIVAAQSQLRAEVACSYLNWFWWILEPCCFMLIYTFIFGYVFKAKELYFPAFIFIGLSMWDFFSRMVKVSVKLIKNNKAIVSKVYLPKYILILNKIWVNGFKMLISFGLVVIMMLIYRIPLTLNIFYALPVLLLLIMFSFGCATYLLHYGVFVEDLSNVVSIALKLLFYLTGIFYKVSTRVPAPYGNILLKANPMAFMMETMRNAMLYGTPPQFRYMVFWAIISLALCYGGIRKIYKNENSYVKAI